MWLTIAQAPHISHLSCPGCGAKFYRLQYRLLNEGNRYAVVFADCHRHDGQSEINFTVTFGDWAATSTTKRVTFACRYGETADGDMGCTAIDVPEHVDEALTGRRLTRAQALKHARIDKFWSVVDYMMLSDVAVHRHMHHPLRFRIDCLKHELRNRLHLPARGGGDTYRQFWD
jgi:hypothetical protein